jgi:hypothetical protein
MEIDDAFAKNVEIKKVGAYWRANCKKGLFSLSAPTKEKCVSEARHYFRQYYEDGEYGI